MIVILLLWLAFIAGVIACMVTGVIWPLFVLLGNCLLGAFVMASIDHDDRKLEWFKACPEPTGMLQFLVLEVWPLFLLKHLLEGRRP